MCSDLADSVCILFANFFSQFHLFFTVNNSIFDAFEFYLDWLIFDGFEFFFHSVFLFLDAIDETNKNEIFQRFTKRFHVYQKKKTNPKTKTK